MVHCQHFGGLGLVDGIQGLGIRTLGELGAPQRDSMCYTTHLQTVARSTMCLACRGGPSSSVSLAFASALRGLLTMNMSHDVGGSTLPCVLQGPCTLVLLRPLRPALPYWRSNTALVTNIAAVVPWISSLHTSGLSPCSGLTMTRKAAQCPWG